MKPDEVRTIREMLGFTQDELARVLGVHSVTVSKWECGKLEPKWLQVRLLRRFAATSEVDPDVGVRAHDRLVNDGALEALTEILWTYRTTESAQ